MDKTHVIASSLNDNELARAFSELVAARWDDWDLSPFMVYLVDVCAPAALPYLAEQFDIDGVRGIAMAGDEVQQRDLIKQSIALQKYMGTPWAIREACKAIGFPVIILQEGVTAPGEEPKPEDWAQFRILVEADMAREITMEEARKLRLFVESYKNERSHLIELGFYQSLKETLFRPAEAERDDLYIEVFTLDLSPNPAIINPRGDEVSVEIKINTPFTMPVLVYWGDETNDKVNVTYTGEAGISRISIVSDRNTTGKDREVTANIESPSGVVLGVLTIRQLHKWRNAYSRDYNRAYNTNSPEAAFIELEKDSVTLPATADFDEIFTLQSNIKWKVK